MCMYIISSGLKRDLEAIKITFDFQNGSVFSKIYNIKHFVIINFRKFIGNFATKKRLQINEFIFLYL
jgi:hypothetical protein